MKSLAKRIKTLIRRGLRNAGYDIVRSHAMYDVAEPVVREEFRQIQFARSAIQALLDHYEFEHVLDIGCGAGEQAEAFLRHGKIVTAVDYGRSVYFERNPGRIDSRIGDFNTLTFGRTYDCVWASHVLEHQPDVHRFLRKVHEVTAEGGIVAITVPPMKPQIVGGHLSLWNGGLLLYHLVVSGFDCREASLLRYGYNISVIVRKRSFTMPDVAFDKGDVDRLRNWLPAGLSEGFNGNIAALNWPGMSDSVLAAEEWH